MLKIGAGMVDQVGIAKKLGLHKPLSLFPMVNYPSQRNASHCARKQNKHFSLSHNMRKKSALSKGYLQYQP